MITKSAGETQRLGEKLAKKIAGGGVVCLYGDLGAGKTTLVQGIAKGLGIKRRVISPTFILVRQYKLPIPPDSNKYKIQNTEYLYHIDLYRLQDINEAKAIGIEELLADPTNILLIEWPEKIESVLPKNRWEIYLKSVGETEREINVKRVD